MTESDAQKIVEMQRQDWNRVAPAWEKWDGMLDRNMAFVNYRLVGDARLRPGQQVLDLGCGTGYPALLAAQAVGKEGSVLGLDLADEMLDVARRKAGALGLSNVTFERADAARLPFDSSSWDSIISRFCLMFLPDVPKGVAEIARVLKPGGFLVAAVWSSPEKNPYLRIPIDVLKTFLTIPPPAPEQPGIFRLAKAGDLAGIVSRAGLSVMAEDEVEGESYFDTVDEYWASLKEIAAPIQGLLGKLAPPQLEEAEAQIRRAAEGYRKGKAFALPMAIRIVTARKPQDASA